MSDLQDIIATSSIRAFNAGIAQGLKAGKDHARKEIIDLIELHANSNVELSDQEIVREIEHLQKTDRENGL
jgi:hypothetical protein